LNQITLAANTNSVTFSNIPQNYGDLVLVAAATSTGGADLRLRFNGDTGTTYAFINAGAGDNGAIVSSANASQTSIALSFTAAIDSNRSTHVFQIMDYSAIDKHKTVLARASRAGLGVNMGAARWANSASGISTILMYPDATNFQIGSTFSLYGLVA
jgi:hypothetical protein